MKHLLFLLFFGIIISLTSCTTQSYISSFTNFVDKTDASCQNYSLKQWKRNVNKFKKYGIERFYKEKENLSNEEIKEVLKLDARYLGIVSNQKVIEVSDIIKDIKKMSPDVLSGFYNEFMNRFNRRK